MAAIGSPNAALGCDELGSGDLPVGGGKAEQDLARGRGGLPQVLARIGHRAAAERAGVEGADVGVPHHEPDRGEGNPQLLGDAQGERSPVVLPDVDLAREGRHRSVGADVEPGTRTRRPAARRLRIALRLSRLPDHDQPLGEDIEVVPLLRGGQVPRAPGPGRLRRLAGASRERSGPGQAVRVPRQLRRAAHGAQDAWVRATAADIALQGRLDPRVVGIGVLREQRDRAHDHAGRAVAALEGSDLDEGALHRMQAAVARQALDGGDDVAGRVRGADRARSNRLTVEEHRAGAARALAATRLRAGQPELLAEGVEETSIRRHEGPARVAPIHDDLERRVSVCSSLRARCWTWPSAALDPPMAALLLSTPR